MIGVTGCRLVLHKRVREKALQVRLQYIKKLDTLFQQRRNLNIEAVKVLLPPKVGTPLQPHVCRFVHGFRMPFLTISTSDWLCIHDTYIALNCAWWEENSQETTEV